MIRQGVCGERAHPFSRHAQRGFSKSDRILGDFHRSLRIYRPGAVQISRSRVPLVVGPLYGMVHNRRIEAPVAGEIVLSGICSHGFGYAGTDNLAVLRLYQLYIQVISFPHII